MCPGFQTKTNIFIYCKIIADMSIWSNAFKIPEPPEPTQEEKDLLEVLAEKVKRRGLGEVAAFTVESTAPLHDLGAQGLTFIEPALTMLFKKEDVEKYRALLQNSKAVKYLVDRLNSEPEKKEDSNVKERP